MEAPGIIFCVALPLAGAVVVVALGRWPNLREAASLATAGWLLLEVLALLPAVETGERPAAVLTTVIPEIPIAFEVEPLGMMFALVASFLWIVTTIYSIGYMRGHGEANQTRFYACFAVAIASAIGVAFAANLLTLFVFYEALTLSTYPLVTHSGTDEARRAGRVYLGVLLGTSIAFQLFAILWVFVLTGRPASAPAVSSPNTPARPRPPACSRSSCSASARRPSCRSTAGSPPRWSLRPR